MGNAEHVIRAFVQLGERFEVFGRDPSLETVINAAVCENPWFTREDILRAAGAIRENMLQEELLRTWLACYPALPAEEPKRVAVIAAGNIPWVGFFDLLAVLAAGDACLLKSSSKDRVLMCWAVETLQKIDSALQIEMLEVHHFSALPDAVIATGNDNTKRYFRNCFREIPSVLRGHRTSVAMLTGNETDVELAGLAEDIFSYSGLGCRNVTHLLLPKGYDLEALVARFALRTPPNCRYVKNYRQRRALLAMQGVAFSDGGFFVLRESADLPAALSEITCRFYHSRSESEEWIAANESSIQCIASSDLLHPRAVPFGRTQFPTLSDYPDGVDLLHFLAEI